MQTTRCPLYTFCELFFDQTKIVYFRMKLKNLQHANKTPWLYVQQSKCPPINIQNFPFSHFTCVYLFTYCCLDVEKEQPELLTPPLPLLH